MRAAATASSLRCYAGATWRGCHQLYRGHACRPPILTRPGEVLFPQGRRAQALAGCRQPCATIGARRGATWPAASGPVAAPTPSPTVRASRSRCRSCPMRPPGWRATVRPSDASSSCSTAGPGIGRCCGRFAPTPTPPTRSTGRCCRRSSRSRSPAPTPASTEAKIGRIEAWLRSVLLLRRTPGAGEITAHNNHHLLRASVDMAWGALTGDTAISSTGITAYRRGAALDARRRQPAAGDGAGRAGALVPTARHRLAGGHRPDRGRAGYRSLRPAGSTAATFIRPSLFLLAGSSGRSGSGPTRPGTTIPGSTRDYRRSGPGIPRRPRP